jgi:hypothetical protein
MPAMKFLKHASAAVLVGVALTALLVGASLIDQPITDQDIERLMRGDRWIKWVPGQEPVTRKELYVALYDWKRRAEGRSDGIIIGLGALILAATAGLLHSNRSTKQGDPGKG